MPDELLWGEPAEGNWLECPPDMESVEEHKLLYYGVLKRFRGPETENTAVVRTLNRFDVTCSTEGCQGLGRLNIGELVTICHHKSGDKEGQTFIESVAAECTPVASRAPSPPRSRSPSPVRAFVEEMASNRFSYANDNDWLYRTDNWTHQTDP